MYMELVSVFENADKLGVPIPKFISDKLNNNKNKEKNENT